MNTEEITIGLIGDYKYVGFKEENIEQRKAFLAVLAFILVSKTHEDYLDEPLLRGVDHLCGIENNVAMLKESHQDLLDEIKAYYGQSRSMTEKAIDCLLPLVTNSSLQGMSALNALEIYDRTLQRLQKMNVEDNLSRAFQYDYFPVELAVLVTRLTEGRGNIHLAELHSADGRFACMCSAISGTFHASIAAEKQSPDYIKHMLTVAGISSSDVRVSSKDFKSDFDISIMVTPTNNSDALDIASAIKDQLKSLNDDGIAIAIVGRGILTVEQHKEFRSSLIENGNVKSVIELPAKLLTPNTPELFAVVLCKRNPTNMISFWCHGESYLSKGRINALTLEGLIDPESSVSVDRENVKKQNLNLMPRSYSNVGSSRIDMQIDKLRKKLPELQQKNDRSLEQVEEMLINSLK